MKPHPHFEYSILIFFSSKCDSFVLFIIMRGNIKNIRNWKILHPQRKVQPIRNHRRTLSAPGFAVDFAFEDPEFVVSEGAEVVVVIARSSKEKERKAKQDVVQISHGKVI